MIALYCDAAAGRDACGSCAQGRRAPLGAALAEQACAVRTLAERPWMAYPQTQSTQSCSGGSSAVFALLPPERAQLENPHRSRLRGVRAAVLDLPWRRARRKAHPCALSPSLGLALA